MKIETGKKYVQRNGEVVTVLSTVAAGTRPVVVQEDRRGFISASIK